MGSVFVQKMIMTICACCRGEQQHLDGMGVVLLGFQVSGEATDFLTAHTDKAP